MANLRIGSVEDGYVYVGGNPKDQRAWAPIDSVRQYMQEEPSFLASMGRGMMDVGQGIKQAALSGMDAITGGNRAEGYTRDVQDEIATYQQGVKGMDLGRITGNIAATLPAALVGGGAGVASIGRAAASGALAGGAQFVPEGESRASNAAVGGLLGGAFQAVPVGFQALRTAANPSQTQSAAANAAQQMGMRLRPGQATGSRTLQRIEAGMENTAGGGLAMEQLDRANQVALNREISQRLGFPARDKLDRTFLAAADRRKSAYYTAALKDQSLKPDRQFIDDLDKIVQEFNPPGARLDAEIVKRIDDLKGAGTISGKDYNAARSLIGRDANAAFKAENANRGRALEAIQEAYDDLAERSLPEANADLLRRGRDMARQLKTLEKAVNPRTGDVQPVRLVNAVDKKDVGGSLYGKGANPLMDAADAASFLRPLPDSFTAARLGGMGLFPAAGAAAGGYQGGAEGAVAGAALGLAAPYLLTRGYLSATAPGASGGLLSGLGRYAVPSASGLLAQP